MQLQVTPAGSDRTTAKTALLERAVRASNRRAYLLRAAEALAAGELDALPRVAQAWGLPDEGVCQDCRGTGYVDSSYSDRPTDMPVTCPCVTPDPHPGFDLHRMARATVGQRLRHEHPGEGFRRVFTLCRSCSVTPAALEVEVSTVVVPWVPDCGVCGDTGWEPVDDRLTVPMSAAEWTMGFRA